MKLPNNSSAKNQYSQKYAEIPKNSNGESMSVYPSHSKNRNYVNLMNYSGAESAGQ